MQIFFGKIYIITINIDLGLTKYLYNILINILLSDLIWVIL